MEGVDRLNELRDEMLVNNIMSRLDCTTKEVIKTTATISKRWKNLWASLPHLIFSNVDDGIDLGVGETDLHGYISFIDNTLNQCPTNLNLKKFMLYIDGYSSLANSEFKSRANSWIRYAISRNVEDVDLRLWVGETFSYDEELLFNNSCFNHVKLSDCVLNPPNGSISWGRLKCLCLSCVTLDEDMIEKILSGSPCLESMELNYCYGYRQIDINSKSVKNLVFSGYDSEQGTTPYEEASIDCVKIDAPYISSLTIEGVLVLRELVLLNVSSLVEAHVDYSRKSGIFNEEEYEEVLGRLLESLGHVEDITIGYYSPELLMEGVDRLNELSDEFLVDNIMTRLDCTTKELIRTTTTISKRWKNLWTQLPHLIFSDADDITDYVVEETDTHGYISFIDNTLNQCPTDLNLKKFELDINYSSLVTCDFKSRANSWIRYAICRNVEEVDLRLWDVGVGGPFSYDDELFFNTSCITRMTLSWCMFNPPNGAICWERLECLCLSFVTLDEHMIENISSGSPCLKSLELDYCYGYRRIDITSKSVKKLVFSGYHSYEIYAYDQAYIDRVKINAPYISSLTIKGELVLRKFALLNVSSLVEAHLDYSVNFREYVMYDEKAFKGILESLGHVEDITFGHHCSELLSRLKAGTDTFGCETSGSDTSDDY